MLPNHRWRQPFSSELRTPILIPFILSKRKGSATEALRFVPLTTLVTLDTVLDSRAYTSSPSHNFISRQSHHHEIHCFSADSRWQCSTTSQLHGIGFVFLKHHQGHQSDHEVEIVDECKVFYSMEGKDCVHRFMCMIRQFQETTFQHHFQTSFSNLTSPLLS